MPTPLPRLVVGIEEETRRKLRILAAAHHRSISGEVTVALEAWLEKHLEAIPQEIEGERIFLSKKRQCDFFS